MPFVMCKQHGGNIAPHMCRHAAERVWAGRPPGKITHVDLDGVFFMGWVCDACLDLLAKKGLEAYLEGRKGQKDYPAAGEIDNLIDGLDFQPVCPKCLESLAQ
jgi:hypothetical protein